jgi:23S rRNA pseudouridine1911/1915/1917 synthase
VAHSHRFLIRAEDDGLRLDQAIAKNVATVSRTLAKKLIAEGGVFLEKKRTKVAGRLVRAGQQVEVHEGERTILTEHEGASVDIPIVELTGSYVVIDKPSGVFSAPTPESDRNDAMAFVSRILKERGEPDDTLYLVHRLDRPTSGLMVFARTKAAAASLSAQLAEKSAGRHYEAIVVGALNQAITVTAPLDGKEAETSFAPRTQRQGATLVEASLKTGRTHQVRLHAEHLGTPIAGDSKYGRRLGRALLERPPRMALHAARLSFRDPETGTERAFSSPLPQDLVIWFNSLPDLR